MIRVLVNETFKDKYDDKKKYMAGETYELSEERVKEIKDVKPTLITELGRVEILEPKKSEEPKQLEPKIDTAEDTEEAPLEKTKGKK